MLFRTSFNQSQLPDSNDYTFVFAFNQTLLNRFVTRQTIINSKYIFIHRQPLNLIGFAHTTRAYANVTNTYSSPKYRIFAFARLLRRTRVQTFVLIQIFAF